MVLSFELSMEENALLDDLEAKLDTILAKLVQQGEMFRSWKQQHEERFRSMEKSIARITQSLEAKQRPKEPELGVPSHTSDSLTISAEQPTLAAPRRVRPELPSFDGKDALQWISKAEELFLYYELTDPYRLRVATIHFDGPVVPWFQELQQSESLTSWASLKKAILAAASEDAFQLQPSENVVIDDTKASATMVEKDLESEDTPQMFDEILEDTVQPIEVVLGFDSWNNTVSTGVDSSPHQDHYGFASIECVGSMLSITFELKSETVEPMHMGSNLKTEETTRDGYTVIDDVAEFATVRHQLEVLDDRLHEMVPLVDLGDGHFDSRWDIAARYYGQSWTVGDGMGCGIKLASNVISFYRNGVSLGVDFDGILKLGPGLCYFPAVSFPLTNSTSMVILQAGIASGISEVGCEDVESLGGGKQIHGYAYRSGAGVDISVSNVLIYFFCKCFRIQIAHKLFYSLLMKNLMSWTKMIAVVGGVAVLVLFLSSVCLILCRRTCQSTDGEQHLLSKLMAVNYSTGLSSELLANARLSYIGQSSMGKSYKGRLENGNYVLIRGLALFRRYSIRNLKLRLDLLSKFRHPHFVCLLGHYIYGPSDDSSINGVYLIYKYLPNGNLRNYPSMHRIQLSNYGLFRISEEIANREAWTEGKLHVQDKPPPSETIKWEDYVCTFGSIILEVFVATVVPDRDPSSLSELAMSLTTNHNKRKGILNPFVYTTSLQESNDNARIMDGEYQFAMYQVIGVLIDVLFCGWTAYQISGAGHSLCWISIDTSCVSCGGLFGFLPLSSSQNVSALCGNRLYGMIGIQIDQATLGTLLVPAPNGMHNLCYVNLVLRFLKYVLHTVGLISVVRLKKLGNLMYSYIAEIDTKLHQFVSGSGAILHLMAAICCGTVGQKVVKACSGKLHPSYQFFYLAFVELLPVVSLNLDEVEPQHRRYDHLICVFRHKLQKELEDAKVFIVQYGTLGGEFLKNMAIIGVYCSSKRKLTIKDDDCSNICATNWGVHEGLHRSCSECEMGGQFIDPQPNTAPFISSFVTAFVSCWQLALVFQATFLEGSKKAGIRRRLPSMMIYQQCFQRTLTLRTRSSLKGGVML